MNSDYLKIIQSEVHAFLQSYSIQIWYKMEKIWIYFCSVKVCVIITSSTLFTQMFIMVPFGLKVYKLENQQDMTWKLKKNTSCWRVI